MAKKSAPKKLVSAESFDLSAFKKANDLNHTVKKKELTWIPLSEAFFDATKLPGIPRGFFTSFRGYSNTGKSTAIYEAVAGAQRIGDLPVIYETEGNWNWEHARNIGVKFEEVYDDNGDVIDYDGDFIFIGSDALLSMYGNYDYASSKEMSKPLRDEPVIEDIARHMDFLLEKQKEGDLPRNLAFYWDSVGSLNGFKSVMSKSSNNQWNALSMEQAFKSIVNHKIPSSQNLDKQYTNTFAVVQKIWLDNENKVIKHKGGEAFFYSPRLIFHFGGILSHSTTKLKATSGGNTYQFGIETRIKCEKNQVNGIEEQGKICSTPHGYWNPDKIEQYKKEYKDFILHNLGTEYSTFDVVREESTISEDEIG